MEPEKTGVQNLSLKSWCVNFTPFEYTGNNRETVSFTYSFLSTRPIKVEISKHVLRNF